MQYCSLQHQTSLTLPVTSNWVLFLLWLCLFILSGVISPVFSSSILGNYYPGEFMFQCHIFLPFHTVHGVLKARILKRFTIPFSSGACIVRSLHHDLSILGGPNGMAHSFTKLDKAVVHVIRLVMRNTGDFPGGPVVKNLPCNAGPIGLIPGRRTQIPYATEQLSPHVAITEPTCHN